MALAAGEFTRVSSTDTAITLEYSAIADAVCYRIYCKNAATGESVFGISYITTTQLSYTITGLSPETAYIVNYCGQDAMGYGGDLDPHPEDERTILTQPEGWNYELGHMSAGVITDLSATDTTITLLYMVIPGAATYEFRWRRRGEVNYQSARSNAWPFVITGLSSGTTYIVDYVGVGSDGSTTPTSVTSEANRTITTSGDAGSSEGSEESTAGSITDLSATDTTITVSYTTIPGAVTYKFLWRKQSEVDPQVAYSNDYPYIIKGLSPNTTYVVNYAGVGSDGYAGPPSTTPEAERTITTSSSGSSGKLPAGYIRSLSATSTSITLTYDEIAGASSYRIYCKNKATGQSVFTNGYISTYSLSYTITGLSPNTTYIVNYCGQDASGYGGDHATNSEAQRTITTKASSGWSWENPIAQGLTMNITHTEWNNFCAFINEVRQNQGLAAYGFTEVFRGTLVSASIMNEVRTAIDAISGHGTLPAVINPGDPITADVFIKLTDAINAVA